MIVLYIIAVCLLIVLFYVTKAFISAYKINKKYKTTFSFIDKVFYVYIFLTSTFTLSMIFYFIYLIIK